MEPKEWEKEFDKVCPPAVWNRSIKADENISIPVEMFEFLSSRKAVKDFISKLLLEQKKKAIDAMGDERTVVAFTETEDIDMGYNIHRAEALRRLEETL